VRGCRNETLPGRADDDVSSSPGGFDGGPGSRMKPGSCSGVKGAVNACDFPERPLLRRESVET
jgi:hypothetical protein